MPMLSTIKVSRPTLLAMDKVLRAAKASPKAKARGKAKVKETKEAKAMGKASPRPNQHLLTHVKPIGRKDHAPSISKANVLMTTTMLVLLSKHVGPELRPRQKPRLKQTPTKLNVVAPGIEATHRAATVLGGLDALNPGRATRASTANSLGVVLKAIRKEKVKVRMRRVKVKVVKVKATRKVKEETPEPTLRRETDPLQLAPPPPPEVTTAKSAGPLCRTKATARTLQTQPQVDASTTIPARHAKAGLRETAAKAKTAIGLTSTFRSRKQMRCSTKHPLHHLHPKARLNPKPKPRRRRNPKPRQSLKPQMETSLLKELSKPLLIRWKQIPRC